MKSGLVSIIIPTKNSSGLLEVCLKKLRNQRYKNIEIILVDGYSNDRKKLIKLSKKYRCKLYYYRPKVQKGLFDATMKRNFAVQKTQGEYIYHFDADMEITRSVINEAVTLCKLSYDAIIVKEDSFGNGIWAQAKNLERRFFWGDNLVESPRFFKKKVWYELGGYDEDIAGGGDDRDLHQKMLKGGYKIARTKNYILHNEGSLTLWHLMKKQFMYKREVLKYIRKRPDVAFQSFFPIRIAYFVQWKMLAFRPKDTFYLIIMKTFESVAGLYGMMYSLVKT